MNDHAEREDTEKNAKLYRIGEFATMIGVSVRTIRFYDLEGLLVSRRRTLAGFRLYDASDYKRLKKIVALKCLGVPLSGIKLIIEASIDNLYDILKRQSLDLSNEADRLKKKERLIRELINASEHSDGISWENLFLAVEAINKEEQMSKFSLSESQLVDATTQIIYPKGKPRLAKFAPVITVTVLAIITSVSLLFKQYVGAAIAGSLAGGYVLINIKARNYKKITDARSQRLASVQYSIDVIDSGIHLEYGKSRFDMPFENIHVKKSSDFYNIVHELGLMVHVPASSLNDAQCKIIERHLASGPAINWGSKNLERA